MLFGNIKYFKIIISILRVIPQQEKALEIIIYEIKNPTATAKNNQDN